VTSLQVLVLPVINFGAIRERSTVARSQQSRILDGKEGWKTQDYVKKNISNIEFARFYMKFQTIQAKRKIKSN